MKWVWVPEKESMPGAYASRTSDKFIELTPLTVNLKQAMHFETYEACRDWCLKRKERFIPQQHGV